jgi:chloramphenicol-sensitive protein RarD
MIEASLLLPVAVTYWYFMPSSESSNLFNNTTEINSLLIGLGIVTTLPLLCFTAAAKRLQYTTIGFIQYIGPSLMFILAVALYEETMEIKDMITFGFIWAGLILFTWDSIRHSLKDKSLKEKTL